jgi:glucose uptake protein GlcU
MGDFVVGMMCCVVAGLLFGTNYIPVQSVDCGDGFFFSLMMSVGILLVGTVVGISPLSSYHGEWEWDWLSSQEFYPVASLGGAAWMIGNLLVPTVIRRVGLGLGMTIWDLSNMIMGWGTGMFGWFGVWSEDITNLPLNVTGVVLCAISLFFFVAAGQADEHSNGAHQADVAEVLCPYCLDLSMVEEGDPEVDLPDVEEGRGSPAGAPSRSAVPGGIEGTTTTATEATAATFSEQATAAMSKDSTTSPRAQAMEVTSAVSGALDGSALAAQPVERGASHVVADLSDGKAKGTTDICEQRTRSRLHRYITGLFLAILAGCLFGYTFDLPTYLIQCGKIEWCQESEECHVIVQLPKVCQNYVSVHHAHHSINPINYVFSHFCGIAETGLIAFLFYACCKRKRTYAPARLVLPSILSGVMWGIAQTAWFVANAEMQLSIAFPIISTLPGLVALACGFFFFGELATRASRQYALIGIALRVPGVIMIALSNM